MEKQEQSDNKKAEAKQQIPAPKFVVAEFLLRGTSYYVSNKFSAEARGMMRAKQAEGSTSKKGKARPPKDFDRDFRQSIHWAVGEKGPQAGVPASCFRQAMVSACRIIGFKMTLAKLALFVEHDAVDE